MVDDTDTIEKPETAQPQPVDSAAAQAQYAREAAAKRLAKPFKRAPIDAWKKPDPAQPAPSDEQPYDAFDTDADTGDAGLAARARLNATNSYYRGTLAGSSRLAEMARVV